MRILMAALMAIALLAGCCPEQPSAETLCAPAVRAADERAKTMRRTGCYMGCAEMLVALSHVVECAGLRTRYERMLAWQDCVFRCDKRMEGKSNDLR